MKTHREYLHQIYFIAFSFRAFIARNGGSVIEYAEAWDGLINDEKPGMRLYDESPFKNLIPYTVGGSEEHHTWHEILAYYASEEDFVFDFSHWPEISTGNTIATAISDFIIFLSFAKREVFSSEMFEIQ